MNKILLIYPSLGFYASFILHPPISLLYLASACVKQGIGIEIFDCRLMKNWRQELIRKLEKEAIDLVGISVMSGLPVRHAAEISRIVKTHSNAAVIWGGPHPTILPEETLNNPYVDFVIRGSGSCALLEFARAWSSKQFINVPGLCYKEGQKKVIKDINAEFEILDYRDIPYHLIDSNMEKYINATRERTLPIFTSAGCPYQCAFCISPIWYRHLKRKWVPYPADNVIEHIKFLKSRYAIELIYLYDDDSFIEKGHFLSIADALLKEGIRVKIGVRGFRVNELDSLGDNDFRLLIAAGIKYLHIGVESGSRRILQYIKKGITLEQILNVNAKLSRYPGLVPIYNFLSGFPGETIDDLKETKKIMLKLVKGNRNSIIFGPARYIPYPGSELYAIARENGFRPPEKIEDWAYLDQEGRIDMPWYKKNYSSYLTMLWIASHVIDNRERLIGDFSVFIKLLYKTLKFLYYPIISFRLKYDFHYFLLERHLHSALIKSITSFNRSADK